MGSKLANRLKLYFDAGLYNNENIASFVKKGRITAADYEEITGEQYPEDE